MIGKNIKQNDEVKPNSRELIKLKAEFPQFFTNKGEFKIGIFNKFLTNEDISFSKEGYELKFLGKTYARYLSSVESETFIAPKIEHNEKEENKRSENLYIVGDNIDALKHLLKSYSGQIKCIYIDPPYNTGSDSFVYPDNFQFDKDKLADAVGLTEDEAERILDLAGKSTHSAWLTFMYPRLLLSRELLNEYGSIFISIDDNEFANLKLICDEIFGEENFQANISVVSNPGGRDYKEIAVTNESLLIYSKSAETKLNEISKKIEFKLKDENGGYELRELRNRNPKFHSGNRPNLFYPFYVNPNFKNKDSQCAVSLTSEEGYTIEVYPYNSKGAESCWRWGKEKASKVIIGDNISKSQIIAREKRDGNWNIYEKNRKMTTKVKSLWNETTMRTEAGTREFNLLFKDSYFDHPKPVDLVKRCIEISTEKDDIVLDFFSGSSTTAQACMQMNAEDGGNRKYIMIQLPEKIEEKKFAYKAGYRTIDEIGCDRIKKASDRIKKETNANIDYGFRLFHLEKPTGKTLKDLVTFKPETKLISEDMITVFANEHASGKESILSTWINEDGYGLSREAKSYKLETYEAELIGKTLYLIEEGLKSQDIMKLVKRIEQNKLDINRVVIYVYSLEFHILQELRKNLYVLKNNTNVNLIERY